MSDLISRTDAIEAVRKVVIDNDLVDALKALPSADAVSREEYEETDGVITIEKQSAKDVGEIKHIVIRSPNYTRYFYNESMPTSAEAVHKPDYSYEADMVKRLRQAVAVQGEWIPVSERLPEDSGNYLVCPCDGVIEDYSDCRDVMIMPYDADCEAFGWWTERYDPISLGFVDSDFDEFEVLAWMPLPEPYRKDGEE